METNTHGVFFLGANSELDAVTSFNISFIPSLGSFFNPANLDHSKRLLAFATSGHLEGDVNYIYEFALQIEGWGDAWQWELTNGTEIGLDVAIHNPGESITYFGNWDVCAGREGNSNLPNLWQFFDTDKGADGYVTDAEEWEQRRQELLELAQFYEYGYKPRLGEDYTLELISNNYDDGDQAAVTARVTPTNARYTGGEARDISIEVALPTISVDGSPAPVALGSNFIDAGLEHSFRGLARDECTDAGARGNPIRKALTTTTGAA